MKVFMFIYDQNDHRAIHFGSHPDQDFMEIFNKSLSREFFSNLDVSKFFHIVYLNYFVQYMKTGGRKDDIPTDGITGEFLREKLLEVYPEGMEEEQELKTMKYGQKIPKTTSKLGSLNL